MIFHHIIIKSELGNCPSHLLIMWPFSRPQLPHIWNRCNITYFTLLVRIQQENMTMLGIKPGYTGLAQYQCYFQMADWSSTMRSPYSKTSNLIIKGCLSFLLWSKKVNTKSQELDAKTTSLLQIFRVAIRPRLKSQIHFPSALNLLAIFYCRVRFF